MRMAIMVAMAEAKNVYQVVADQDQADQSVGAIKQFASTDSAAVILLLQMFQSITIETHHACL